MYTVVVSQHQSHILMCILFPLSTGFTMSVDAHVLTESHPISRVRLLLEGGNAPPWFRLVQSSCALPHPGYSTRVLLLEHRECRCGYFRQTGKSRSIVEFRWNRALLLLSSLFVLGPATCPHTCPHMARYGETHKFRPLQQALAAQVHRRTRFIYM